MMSREIDKPSPIPFSLVDMKGWNMGEIDLMTGGVDGIDDAFSACVSVVFVRPGRDGCESNGGGCYQTNESHDFLCAKPTRNARGYVISTQGETLTLARWLALRRAYIRETAVDTCYPPHAMIPSDEAGRAGSTHSSARRKAPEFPCQG